MNEEKSLYEIAVCVGVKGIYGQSLSKNLGDFSYTSG